MGGASPNKGMKLTGSATPEQPRPPQLIPVVVSNERRNISAVIRASALVTSVAVLEAVSELE
jgi:hypothetical protein